MSGSVGKSGEGTSVRNVPPQQDSSPVKEKDQDQKVQKDDGQSAVDDSPPVQAARGKDSYVPSTDGAAEGTPAAARAPGGRTAEEARTDYGLARQIADTNPRVGQDTFLTMASRADATDEYQAELGRQIARNPSNQLNLTVLSQSQTPGAREAVTGVLRAAHDAKYDPLTDQQVAANAVPPKGSPAAVDGLWREAKNGAPPAAGTGAAEHPEGPEAEGGPLEAAAGPASNTVYAVEQALKPVLDKLPEMDRELATSAIGKLGSVFEAVESSEDFKSGIELMKQGNYGEGALKLAHAAASITPALANLVEDVNFGKGIAAIAETAGKKAFGAGSILGGVIRMVYGKDGAPDATDRTAGVLKVATGAMQLFPATSLAGTIAGIGVDIADESGLLRSAVEGTQQVAGNVGDAINRHLTELQELQRQNPDIFLPPVGGGA